MKVLLKKEVCRSREQCTGPTEKTTTTTETCLKKKNADANANVDANNHYPNGYLVLSLSIGTWYQLPRFK